MDFGKSENLDAIDFKLPDDHAETEVVLKKSKSSKKEVYVGCAKWGREDWIGTVYPKGTKQKDFLAHYVKTFNSIELNALFYRLQKKKVIEDWASLADDSFRFCPKFSYSITHMRQLRNAEESTDRFIEHMQVFGKKLGHSFIQLSEKFGPNRAGVIKDYLTKIPRDFKTAIEFRHPDWFVKGEVVDNMFSLLKELGIASVITDTAGRRDCIHMRLTTPVAFIRYVGNDKHATDFVRIDHWVQRLKQWLDKGLETLYFFVHNDDESKSPELCDYVIGELNKVCRANLARPALLHGA